MAAPKRDIARLSDVRLVEMMRSDQLDDADLALQELQARHQPRLEAFVARAIHADWVDDVMQDVWLEFYLKAREVEIREPGAYLRGIARNVRADGVERITTERAIETDEDIGTPISPWLEEEIAEREERIRQHFQLEVATLAPFAERFLAPCQVPIFMLNAINEYSGDVVGKLLGKKRGNYPCSRCRRRVKESGSISSPLNLKHYIPVASCRRRCASNVIQPRKW